MQGVVNSLASYLKFGGIFLFRDYGRYDFSQLRFKKGESWICWTHFWQRLVWMWSINRFRLFAIRSVLVRQFLRTRRWNVCLFFHKRFVSKTTIMQFKWLHYSPVWLGFISTDEVHGLFSNAGLEEVQNLEDRRIQVNRGKKVSMHRVWMQSKYRKSHPPSPC